MRFTELLTFLRRLAELVRLHEHTRLFRCSRPNNAVWVFGPKIGSSWLSVDNVVTPKLTLTASLGCCTYLTSPVLTMTLANQPSALRLTFKQLFGQR